MGNPLIKEEFLNQTKIIAGQMWLRVGMGSRSKDPSFV